MCYVCAAPAFQEQADSVEGEYYTLAALELLPGWTKPVAEKLFKLFMDLRAMAKHAADWAVKNGLNQQSPIHGCEEYKIPSKHAFRFENKQRSIQRASSSVNLETGCFSIDDALAG